MWAKCFHVVVHCISNSFMLKAILRHPLDRISSSVLFSHLAGIIFIISERFSVIRAVKGIWYKYLEELGRKAQRQRVAIAESWVNLIITVPNEWMPKNEIHLCSKYDCIFQNWYKIDVICFVITNKRNLYHILLDFYLYLCIMDEFYDCFWMRRRDNDENKTL